MLNIYCYVSAAIVGNVDNKHQMAISCLQKVCSCPYYWTSGTKRQEGHHKRECRQYEGRQRYGIR
jgi:hypothetical protein